MKFSLNIAYEYVSVVIVNVRPHSCSLYKCTSACSQISRIGSVDGYDVSADNFEP